MKKTILAVVAAFALCVQANAEELYGNLLVLNLLGKQVYIEIPVTHQLVPLNLSELPLPIRKEVLSQPWCTPVVVTGEFNHEWFVVTNIYIE